MRLALSDIYKSYGGKAVLNGFTYAFEPGLVYAVMGPNGCGKSTLLRIACLLEPPDRGSVIYLNGDTPVENGISLRRRITLLLPGIGVFNTSVYKNAAYGPAIRGIKGDSARERVMAALEAVGLSGKSRQNALTLSSGEKQRLGIARAMAVGPDILFLDEPTASVDEDNTKIIENIILDMRRRGKNTIIMSTHDRRQAERLADGIIDIKGLGV
jgi:tungstate transport system ATP-binding protein